MKYYFYNHLSNNGIKPEFKEDMQVLEAVGLDYKKFFDGLAPEDEVVLVGGDGTLNHFVNEMGDYKIKNNVYLLANGTGNDFMKDIDAPLDKEVKINKYFENLPTASCNGITKKFLNNMSFGIDGYCCEEADRIKEKTPNKKIDYTSIAIKGLLFKFSPCHAWITVDGKDYEYDDVWLAPTMHGRYVGGGMMMAPQQDRFGETQSVVIYHCKSKLKSLMAFPSIFKGEHVLKKDMVEVITGKEVHVKFSRPCAVQIDGDTILNVTEYTVTSK